MHLSVTIENIAAYIIQHPKLIEDWELYTENIRHGPAWGFGKNEDGSWSVSYPGNDRIIEIYRDKFIACAKMIKMTLEEDETPFIALKTRTTRPPNNLSPSCCL
jgi:hypothetical protein